MNRNCEYNGFFFFNFVSPSKLLNLRVGLETPVPHPRCSMRRYEGLFLLPALSLALPWRASSLAAPSREGVFFFFYFNKPGSEEQEGSKFSSIQWPLWAPVSRLSFNPFSLLVRAVTVTLSLLDDLRHAVPSSRTTAGWVFCVGVGGTPAPAFRELPQRDHEVQLELRTTQHVLLSPVGRAT